MSHSNFLYYGDNLDNLRRNVRAESVDLCYIDPPFNSKRNYNQIYNNIGREDRAQAQAFVDTWTWDDHANYCFEQVMSNANGVQTRQSIELIKGLEKVLGKSSLMAYLVSMAVRIAEIHRTLKPTGSFYLHCDPTASHYLKLVCDAIFVPQGGDYKNEIAWKRNTAHSDAVGYGRIRDIIFFYTKSDKATWNETYQKYEQEYVKQYYRYEDSDGRKWMSSDMSAAGLSGGGYDYEWNGHTKTWRCPMGTMQQLHDDGKLYYTKNGVARRKRYLDEAKGMPAQDLWSDIQALRSWHQEKLGYPTQKPEALLERIISASSNEGDTILDAFCGCGTTVAVANRMNRRWIGIDITYQSVSLILKRLAETDRKAVTPQAVTVQGIPRDLEGVDALIHQKDDRVRKEYEKWSILTFTENRGIINEKKGADRGIDGTAYIGVSKDSFEPLIVSVKSGRPNLSELRDLRGVIEREKAIGGVLITRHEPTKAMVAEAKSAGQVKKDYLPVFDRIRIITAQELLDGARLNLPTASEVLKRAQAKGDNAKQIELVF